jgi:uncharacterized membrane protein
MPMTTPIQGDVTSDDKLWVALAYIFTPLVPIILLLMADKKDRLFIKANTMQALIWGIAVYVISAILSPALGLGCLIWLVGIVFQIYWAYQSYQGKTVVIPVLTDFCKKQGWA